MILNLELFINISFGERLNFTQRAGFTFVLQEKLLRVIRFSAHSTSLLESGNLKTIHLLSSGVTSEPTIILLQAICMGMF
jgi:hypothetical protein